MRVKLRNSWWDGKQHWERGTHDVPDALRPLLPPSAVVVGGDPMDQPAPVPSAVGLTLRDFDEVRAMADAEENFRARADKAREASRDEAEPEPVAEAEPSPEPVEVPPETQQGARRPRIRG